MSRLAPLRLVTSPTHLYKKLEEFGKDYDNPVKEMVETDEKWFAEKVAKENNSSEEPISTPVGGAEPSPGFKLTIDNVDYHEDVHYMTEEHQNIDKHYVTVNATTNRITGNNLSTDCPVDGLLQMENGKCLPSHLEQKAQRENYITLVQRTLVENVPCLEFGKDVVEKHILHKYSKEASQPTNSVSLPFPLIHE